METEASMLGRLRGRFTRTYRNGLYLGRRYVYTEKVPTNPGGSHGHGVRVLDALALDTWTTSWGDQTDLERARRDHSAAQSVHGFEVKVSRSDWLTELADPSKADAWARYCHYFWLVAGDRSIVRDDLPDGWGLLVPRGSGLQVVVHPTREDPVPVPLPGFVAVARCAQRFGGGLSW